MVLELMTGSDLEALLRERGPLPVGRAVDYVLQASDAIANAHARGIVHRDIKPANLFLSRTREGRERVKVLDFGISKMAEEGQLGLTAPATMMGSVQYMAPEQMRDAASADVRSDVWALGVTLYELVTGVVPFAGTTFAAVTVAVLGEEPRPPSARAPEVPRELDEIVLRALSKDPAARWPTVAAFAEALEPLRAGDRSVVRSPDAVAPFGATVSTADSTPSGGLSGAVPALGASSAGEVSGSSVPKYDGTLHPAALGARSPKARGAGVAALVAGLVVLIGAAALGVFAISRRESASVSSHADVPPSATVSVPGAATSADAVAPVAPVAPLDATSAAASATTATTATTAARATPRPASSATPAGTTPARAAVTAAATATATPKPTATGVADCNPPFTVDAQGVKRAKPQCL